MNTKIFRVITYKYSHRWCVWESDIPGLFLETDSWKEMEASITSITPMLMRENLGLNNSDLANSDIHVLARSRDQSAKESLGSPRFFFEQQLV